MREAPTFKTIGDLQAWLADHAGVELRVKAARGRWNVSIVGPDDVKANINSPTLSDGLMLVALGYDTACLVKTLPDGEARLEAALIEAAEADAAEAVSSVTDETTTRIRGKK